MNPMWTATGTLYGMPVNLQWRDGLLDWPADVLTVLAEAAAANTSVLVEAPDVARPLALDDELSVARWLAEHGLTVTGDLPKVPARTTPFDPNVIY